MARRWAVGGRIALILGAGWAIAGAVLCESAIHVPRFARAPLPAAEFTPVEVRAADSVVLRGSTLAAEGGNGRWVILLHGVGDTRHSGVALARTLRAHGYSALLPDSRGHGESGGLVSYGLHEAGDVHRWSEWLVSTRHALKLFGFGESLGAAVLLQALPLEPRMVAAVAECPFASFHRVAVHRVAQRLPVPAGAGRIAAAPLVWSGFLYARLRYGLDLRAASPEAAIPRTHIPVLLIHGLEDDNIPPEHSRTLASRNPQSAALWLVPGAGHTGAFAAAPEEFERRVTGWFAAHDKLESAELRATSKR